MQQPSGSIETALAHAGKLLDRDPRMAASQAREILKVAPNAAAAMHILASAHRRMGDDEKALEILEPMTKQLSHIPQIMHEYGLVLGALGRSDDAIAALNHVVKTNPKYTEGWRSLAEIYSAAGMEAESEKAYEAHLRQSVQHPELLKAAEHMYKGEIAKAEQIARDVLKKDDTDVSALRILADVGVKVGRYKDAEYLLERALDIAPTFNLARHSYVIVLQRRQKLERALEEVEKLLVKEPNNPNFLILKGSVLVRQGENEEALKIYERLVKDYPNQANAQMNYGHTLKSVGRLDEAIAAYRKCVELEKQVGEAYWSLANLKIFEFTEDDIGDMIARIPEEQGTGDVEEQSHIAFALGKAFEDRKMFDDSFKYYRRGNAIRRIKHPYDPRRNVYDSARQINTMTAEVFKEREGWGSDAKDPIFVVGLPRAGSTLIEQILSSHSQVEGTSELTDIIALSRKLGGTQGQKGPSDYPEILPKLTEDQCREMGDGFIESTRIHRHEDTPRFIDKMPNNFLHIGLIHLILPNAKIIDARRHPMAGCFAGFKQLFAQGQTFTYDLADVGHYYRDYVKVMDHWDEVLPGRIHRVQYEDMVADTETEIRKLLDYCDLPFEEQCLSFYETKRAIRTPSSEQVRQPVYTSALELWRSYEDHLDPLKKALGPLLDRYPI